MSLSSESSSPESLEDLMGSLMGWMKISNRLSHYRSRIEARVERLGETPSPTPEMASELEAARAFERDWQSVHRFVTFAYESAGDLFSFLYLVYENPEAFRKIGASGVLTAAGELEALYEQYAAFEEDEAQRDFYHSIEAERQAAESKAEEMEEFGTLMLQYAEAHEDSFGVDEDREQADDRTLGLLEMGMGIGNFPGVGSPLTDVQQQIMETFGDPIGLTIFDLQARRERRASAPEEDVQKRVERNALMLRTMWMMSPAAHSAVDGVDSEETILQLATLMAERDVGRATEEEVHQKFAEVFGTGMDLRGL